MTIEINEFVLTECEYEKLRNIAISHLSERYPEFNIGNLLRVTWVDNKFPMFYIEHPF